MIVTGIFPYGLVASRSMGGPEDVALGAFFGLYALTHIVCAACMYVRSHSPSTTYSLRTMMLNALFVGSYIGGFVYLFVKEANARDGYPPGDWRGAVPVFLAAVALLWSIVKDSRAPEPPAAPGCNPPPAGNDVSE